MRLHLSISACQLRSFQGGPRLTLQPDFAYPMEYWPLRKLDNNGLLGSCVADCDRLCRAGPSRLAVGGRCPQILLGRHFEIPNIEIPNVAAQFQRLLAALLRGDPLTSSARYLAYSQIVSLLPEQPERCALLTQSI